MRGLAHKHAAKCVTGTCTADFCELANRARETTERERQRGRGGYSVIINYISSHLALPSLPCLLSLLTLFFSILYPSLSSLSYLLPPRPPLP